ncbi:hypothetical protein LGH83_12130 [Lichenihabitans sp. PAMC28606]|nr:hypothetical protein [Lichenihabitans sp. PAMC28606]UDL93335.1 hypothetical protein LGH83_12130 [Lichenihabitans sp. PAMC28606]
MIASPWASRRGLLPIGAARGAVLAVVALLLPVLANMALAQPGNPPSPPVVHLTSAPEIVFAAPRDACDGDDVPDAPARAFREAHGGVRLFGLHTKNRSLSGPDLGTLTIDCRPTLVSHGNADPAAYDDQSWITATWTRDGTIVDGLIHHEYQANQHPGRCRFADYMQCWFNTVLAARSTDGGASFVKDLHPVVASAPFGQEVGQGRHRGFFNPSNIVSDAPWLYVMASTTGWDGQPNGVCLFRTATPGDPQSWRAFDGHGFSVAFADPYKRRMQRQPACAPIGPFPAPVGSLVRRRSGGDWLAVFQAKADQTLFPVSGFYVASSRDLLTWSDPRLLLPGPTLYDDPCRSGGQLLAYPAILDRHDASRNFDQSGDDPDLYYVTLAVEGCTVTSRRTLLRRTLALGR